MFRQKLKQVSPSFVMNSFRLPIEFVAIKNCQKGIILQKYATNDAHYFTKLRSALIIP